MKITLNELNQKWKSLLNVKWFVFLFNRIVVFNSSQVIFFNSSFCLTLPHKESLHWKFWISKTNLKKKRKKKWNKVKYFLKNWAWTILFIQCVAGTNRFADLKKNGPLASPTVQIGFFFCLLSNQFRCFNQTYAILGNYWKLLNHERRYWMIHQYKPKAFYNSRNMISNTFNYVSISSQFSDSEIYSFSKYYKHD